MKNILLSFIFISIFISFQSCIDTHKEYDEAKRAALESGIRVDTIMFGLCFNDSPEMVDKKLKETGRYDYNGLKYRFPDSRIYGMEWHETRAFWFYNDSLVKFTITSFDDSYNWREVIKEIFSAKYGNSIFHDKKDYWFKGNLEICVSEGEMVGKTWKSIKYSNLDSEKWILNNRLHLCDTDDMNWYSEDYWNEHIKPKEENKLKNSGRDI